MIISFSGPIGAGKNAAAQYLVDQHGFTALSFAGKLKDAVSVIFGWDRELLEGTTDESRVWREQVDPWWSQRLNIPHLTPRWILQHVGTEVWRNHFHSDIWLAALERELLNTPGDVVVTDARFSNELEVLRSLGAVTVLITKPGEKPPYWDLALRYQSAIADWQREKIRDQLIETGIHESEWAWVGAKFELNILNHTTLDGLHRMVEMVVKNPALGLPAPSQDR